MSEGKDAIKILVKELKQEGLNVGEDAVKGIVKAVFRACPKFVMSTKTPYDDFLIPVFPIAEKRILEAVDKIDGEIEEEE